MLTLKNIHANYEGKKILNGIDLQVNPGEIHAILGPNGAGKSTLGHVILGNPKFTVTQGDILLENESIQEDEPSERARKGFFLSFQSPPHLDGVTTKDFLFGAKKSIDPTFHSSFRFNKKLESDIKGLHLDPAFKTREMNKGASGGERKKMEVITLQTLNPSVAFLDEIDSGIDVDGLKEIAQCLKTFMEDTSKSLIIISHTEKLLSLIPPTHVHILKNGIIEKSGTHELIQEVHMHGFQNK